MSPQRHPGASEPRSPAPREITVNALQEYFPRRVLLERALVALPEHDVIYVKNPKAGCSTIMLWLDRIHTGDYGFEPDNIHDHNHLPTPPEVKWGRVTEMLRGSAFRFTFVRNPVTKAESAWRDKVLRSQGWRTQLQKTLGLPEDPSAPLSFEQFVTAVEQQDPHSEMNRHWRPQYLNLMHPLVTYDFIGRVEDFDSDLTRVRELAGLPAAPVDAINVSANVRGSAYEGRPDLIRRVETIYAKDMELYDY